MYTVIIISASLFSVAVLAELANISGELKEIRNTLRERNRREESYCINKAPVVIPSDMPTYEEEGEA